MPPVQRFHLSRCTADRCEYGMGADCPIAQLAATRARQPKTAAFADALLAARKLGAHPATATLGKELAAQINNELTKIAIVLEAFHVEDEPEAHDGLENLKSLARALAGGLG